MPVLSFEISQQDLEIFNHIKNTIGDGTNSTTAGLIINSISSIQSNNQTVSISNIMATPSLLLNQIIFKGNIKSEFRRNYNSLPFAYKRRIFKFLYLLTSEISGCNFSGNNICFNGCYVSVAQNLCLYYNNNNEDRLNLYMNITGNIGGTPILNNNQQCSFTNSFRVSNDINSPIWISSYERFISERFYYQGDSPLYDRIVNLLGIQGRPIAVQLSIDDLDKIIADCVAQINAYLGKNYVHP